MAVKSNKTLEKVIEAELVKRAEALGGKAVKLQFPNERGAPDRMVLLPGGWVAYVEVKRPVGGRISANQKRWAKILTVLGHRHYYVATLADLNIVFSTYRV